MFPTEKVQRRQQRRETLRHRLGEYLDAVTVAVRALGFTVQRTRLSPGPDLEAVITIGRGPDPARDGGHPHVPEQVKLAWAEDLGWSVTYPDPDTTDTSAEVVTRYLHLDLVASPDTVAGFLAAVLLDGEDIGMPYPGPFRLRSQPLQPVLDALSRHNPTSYTPRNPITPVLTRA
jgi:hypothetical protein